MSSAPVPVPVAAGLLAKTHGLRGLVGTIGKVPTWVWLLLLLVVVGVGFGATLYVRAERSRLREEYEKEVSRLQMSSDQFKKRVQTHLDQIAVKAAAPEEAVAVEKAIPVPPEEPKVPEAKAVEVD